jgi:hypothetical protein
MAKKITEHVEGQVYFDPWSQKIVVPEEAVEESVIPVEPAEPEEEVAKVCENTVARYYNTLLSYLYANGKAAQSHGVLEGIDGNPFKRSVSAQKTFQDYYEGDFGKLKAAIDKDDERLAATLTAFKKAATDIGIELSAEEEWFLSGLSAAERAYLRNHARKGLDHFRRSGKVRTVAELLKARMRNRKK